MPEIESQPVPAIFHYKAMRMLFIDWRIICGKEPCYGKGIGLWTACVSNDRNFDSIRITFENHIQTLKHIGDLCKELRINKLIISDMFECLSPSRIIRIIEQLRKMIEVDCEIFLTGTVESVCAKVIESSMPSVNIIERPNCLAKVDNLVSQKPSKVGNSQQRGHRLRLLESALKGEGIEDEIKVIFPNVSRPHNNFENDWTIFVNHKELPRKLFKTVVECMDRLGCRKLVFKGSIIDSGIWDNIDDFIHWIRAFKSISFRIQDKPGLSLKQKLNDLCTYGLEGIEICLSTSNVKPEQGELIQSFVEDCAKNNLAIVSSGYLVTESSSWLEVKHAWAICDLIGVDFLEMLNYVPCKQFLGQKSLGWMGTICAKMSKLPSLLFELSKIRTQFQLDGIAYGLNNTECPSLKVLYHVTFRKIRNSILDGLSRHGVLGPTYSDFDTICNLAINDLTDLSEAMNKSVIQNPTIQASVAAIETLELNLPNVAVVVVAANNPLHLKLCLHSIATYTSIPYDLYVLDCGNIASFYDSIPCRAHVEYTRMRNSRLKSFATAWGIYRACHHKYVVILDSNTCALASDWLNEMIVELEETENIGAVGIHYGGELDYENQETPKYLRDYVLSSKWCKALQTDPKIANDELLTSLTVEGKTCFSELTGIVQIYRGHILRRIGVPIVDDRILKHIHWDSELSMRVLASGYRIENSKTASSKLNFFGDRYNSGISGVSSYTAFAEKDSSWLEHNGYTDFAHLLCEEKIGTSK